MSEQHPATKSGAPDPLIGRIISDRYRITQLIARGGMGKVYRAEQAPLGRLCAVKVLNPNYSGDADPEFHRRFFREASITSKITHPNCVTIFDYGKTDDGILYMVMEYLEGQTLHMVLREGGVMHEVRAGRIASQVARALREAHNLGVIHRDLKPANIFLVRPGGRAPSGLVEEDEDFVKVLDFGLVKHLTEKPEEQLTQTGLFMGSPKYMAPEQIQGGHVDARTDIYSLGIIMYEMLAGKVPFERATSVNILMAHVGEPPPPMREVNPNLLCSPAFEDIVMRCIAKEPSERFSSMDEVIGAIRRAHGGGHSLTGQVAAMPYATHQTGPFNIHQTGPPPPMVAGWLPTPSPAFAQLSPLLTPQPMRSSMPSIPPPVLPPGAASSNAGMAMSRVDVPIDRANEPRPRSKIWVLFGVLVAAGIGGGLGMLAFHWTAARVEDVPPAPTPSVSASAAPSASVSAAPSASAAPDKGATVHVTTDPPGATVRENGKDLCAPTPCDLVFKGDDATKTHKVVVDEKGYRSETRSLKPVDAKTLDLKLTKAR